jgi:hypothetical protein
VAAAAGRRWAGAEHPPWPVVGLVAALVLGLVGWIANAAGWLDDPALAGWPAPTAVPAAPVVPEGALEVAGLIFPAWAALAGSDDPGRRRLADSLALHWRVLTGPDPLNRVDPGPQAATPEAAAPAADVAQTLAQVSGAEWSRAQTAPGVEAAWWAGLAGSTDQIMAGLTGPYVAPPPLDPWATIAVGDDAQGARDLMAAYHQAVFTTAAALGRLSRGPAWDQAAADLRHLLQGRNDLQALGQAQLWELPQAAPAYDLPPLGDDQAALAAIGQASRGLAAAAASWLASTSDQRDRALQELSWARQLGQGWASAYWVGWPD